MPKVIFTSATGNVRTIDAQAGVSVMRAAVLNGVEGIVGECGGILSCATCHIFVDDDDTHRFPARSELEDDMLDGTSEDRRPNSRLACQMVLTDDHAVVRVSTPEAQ